MFYIIRAIEQKCSMERGENMKLNRQKYELARAKSCKGFGAIVAAGVPKGTLCRAIGGSDVRPETIGKIAKALECDVTEIIEQ